MSNLFWRRIVESVGSSSWQTWMLKRAILLVVGWHSDNLKDRLDPLCLWNFFRIINFFIHRDLDDMHSTDATIEELRPLKTVLRYILTFDFRLFLKASWIFVQIGLYVIFLFSYNQLIHNIHCWLKVLVYKGFQSLGVELVTVFFISSEILGVILKIQLIDEYSGKISIFRYFFTDILS
jgi:hypothetical protein